MCLPFKHFVSILFPPIFFLISHETTAKKRNSFSISFMADGNIGIFFRFTICLHIMLYSQVLVHILCVLPNSILLHSQSSQQKFFCDFFPFHSRLFYWIIMHETIALCLVLVSKICSIVWKIFLSICGCAWEKALLALHTYTSFILPQASLKKILSLSVDVRVLPTIVHVRILLLLSYMRTLKKIFASFFH